MMPVAIAHAPYPGLSPEISRPSRPLLGFTMSLRPDLSAADRRNERCAPGADQIRSAAALGADGAPGKRRSAEPA